MLRIGVDVGGTHTDAVLMDGRELLSSTKAPTTHDVTSGVEVAIDSVLSRGGVPRSAVAHVMIGTTHFTNAVIERRHLSEVAVIRLGLPAAACVPPMVDWPDDLRAAVGRHVHMLRGGHEYDGRVLSELDVDGLGIIAKHIGEQRTPAAAITSIFSPVNDAFERRARDYLLERHPALRVVISSEIGQIGLLERENATILNASLLELADRTAVALDDALRECGLQCGYSITQNDGTLMSADHVRRLPVLTFGSGPTNSMRGAGFLSGLSDAIVVDVGGTTSDVGALVNGFPRQASTVVHMGGIRTSFRMPDVQSIGVGGGSIVTERGRRVGPRSLGHRITDEGLVFGGPTTTATDAAVRAGVAHIGDRAAADVIPPEVAATALETIHHEIERAVERAQTSSTRVPVLAVGGGAFLLPRRLNDLDVVQLAHAGVANAIGAAIAQVSGEVDRVFDMDGGRNAALDLAEEEARARAVEAGAVPASLELLERDDTPLAYLSGSARRVRVRVIGDLEAPR